MEMENARYKILLIEDNKLDQMAFRQFVEDEDLLYDFTIAGSVSQAHSILEIEEFDIIISDYSLGDGTALDILDSVKNTPIIVVTGGGNEKVAVKAWKAGAYDYLIKDLEQNYLKAIPITIENAIRHKKIKKQLQLLSGAVMSTDDSVYITDMEDKIIFVNKAFCETYGYTEEQVIGRTSDVICRGSLLNTYSENICQSFSEGELVCYHVRKDGTEFPVSLSISIIKDENGNETALVGVARDISERMLAEDKIRSINLKLKNGNRLID
jgi:PAS domain S-box-containing protein